MYIRPFWHETLHYMFAFRTSVYGYSGMHPRKFIITLQSSLSITKKNVFLSMIRVFGHTSTLVNISFSSCFPMGFRCVSFAIDDALSRFCLNTHILFLLLGLLTTKI